VRTLSNIMLKFILVLLFGGILQAQEELVLNHNLNEQELVLEAADAERQESFLDSLIEYIRVNILFCWLSATVCSLWYCDANN